MTSSPQPLPGGGASAPLRWQDIKPDVDNATPLYLQMSRKLAAAIRNGTWRPGDALPSERRLSEALNVSRITSRKALALLVQQGLIRRVHGAGTFIAIPFDDEPSLYLPARTAKPLQQGGEAESHWLSRAIRVASADEVAQLGLSSGDEVADMQWLHDDGGIATALEIAIVPAIFIRDPYALGDVSLHAFRAQFVAPVERQSQRYAAIHAPQQIAAHLRIEPGSAVLRITRISYGHAQRALELTHLYCRSDDCEPVAGWRKPSATTET
jgi:GntR family transcriptional regulator